MNKFKKIPFPFWIAFGLCFVIYLITLAPTVVGGDSGELIAAAVSLGVAHPPGYPTYTLLGHLFSTIPIGLNPAWRMNLFSALAGAIASGLLAWALVWQTRNQMVSVIMGVAFGLSAIVWRYSVVAEVFALNHFFAALILVLSLWFDRAPSRQSFFWTVFVCALGLTHHHTLVFFAFPVFLALSGSVLTHNTFYRRRQKTLLQGVGVGLLGLLPYLYLPWASARNPLISWGDLTTLQGFMTHFLREEYGTLQLKSAQLMSTLPIHSPNEVGIRWPNLLSNLQHFLKMAGPAVGWIGLPLVLLGAWIQLRHAWAWILGSVGYVLVFAALANVNPNEAIDAVILERFWQLPILLLCYFVGLGADFVWNWKPKALRLRWVPWGLRAGLILGVFGLGAVWIQNGKIQKTLQNEVFRDFGKTVLESLPPDSILLSSGDHITNTLLYLQNGEKVRPDVQIVDHFLITHQWSKRWMNQHLPRIVFPGKHLGNTPETGAFSLKDFFDGNSPNFQIFVVNQIRVPDKTYQESYRLWPLALVEYVLPKDKSLQVKEWAIANREIMKRFPLKNLEPFTETTWEGAIRRRLLIQQRDYATGIMRTCSQNLRECADPRLVQEIAEIFSALKKYQVPMNLENAKAEVMAISIAEHLKSDSSRLRVGE